MIASSYSTPASHAESDDLLSAAADLPQRAENEKRERSLHTNTELKRLIEDAQQGSQTALWKICEIARGEMLGPVSRILNRSEHREDIADVIEKALEKLRAGITTYNGVHPPRNWIMRIGTNCALDFLRAHRRRGGQHHSLDDRPDVTDNDSSSTFLDLTPDPFSRRAYQAVEESSAPRRLVNAIELLSKTHKEALLAVVENLDLPDEATSRPRRGGLFRARIELAWSMYLSGETVESFDHPGFVTRLQKAVEKREKPFVNGSKLASKSAVFEGLLLLARRRGIAFISVSSMKRVASLPDEARSHDEALLATIARHITQGRYFENSYPDVVTKVGDTLRRYRDTSPG